MSVKLERCARSMPGRSADEDADGSGLGGQVLHGQLIHGTARVSGGTAEPL